jgi:hypothetical protein
MYVYVCLMVYNVSPFYLYHLMMSCFIAHLKERRKTVPPDRKRDHAQHPAELSSPRRGGSVPSSLPALRGGLSPSQATPAAKKESGNSSLPSLVPNESAAPSGSNSLRSPGQDPPGPSSPTHSSVMSSVKVKLDRLEALAASKREVSLQMADYVLVVSVYCYSQVCCVGD